MVEAESHKVRERGELDAQYLWNTADIFPALEGWEAEFAAVEERIADLERYRGTLGRDGGVLLNALQIRDDTEARLDRVMVYASLLADQDTRDGGHQAMDARATSLGVRYQHAASWIDPELIAIPRETIKRWMAGDGALAVYRHCFDNLWRQQKYILSPREEELIALCGEVQRAPYNAYNLLANADMQFPTIQDATGSPVELSDSAYYTFMRSPDRRVRKDAYQGIIGTYRKFRNTAAALLSGAVQSHVFNMRARGYPSCLAAALDGGNIPVEVYQTLVRTVNEHLPLLHRYQHIRKRALKLGDGVHAYDLFAPLVSGASFEQPYEASVEMVVAALRPLGETYLGPMRQGFASRWVDVFPSRGKRSGAYSSGTYLTQPYILLNYHGGYEDTSTLAHEIGHSMHSFFSRGAQPYIYSSYDIFCAEVASTCNEILLQDHVLTRTEDPRRKLYLLCEFLEGVRGTVFRQTLFSEFEQGLHEMVERNEPLTADSASAAYSALVGKYYGPAYEHDEVVDGEWIRVPHFYYNFYVYKYATSFCAASNIAGRMLAREPGSVEKYLTFLRSGCNDYPVNLLRLAGVEMTTPAPIRDAMRQFEGLLDQTEALLGRIG